MTPDWGTIRFVKIGVSGADLSGAKLGGADLSGADLSEANFTEADLYGTQGDHMTRLPAGRNPPKTWNIM